MPTYEYRCHDCASTFEVRRSMTQSADPAACPSGHDNTVKLLSTVALTGGGGDGASAPTGGAAAAGAGAAAADQRGSRRRHR